MTTIILIGVTVVLLIISFFKDKKKTLEGLKVSKGMLFKTGKDIIAILAIVALALALLPESVIRKLLGSENGMFSAVSGALIGTVTIIPAFIAFPLSGSLVKGGANPVAVAAFITTLTMVGFATLPVEIKHFGKKFAVTRNILSFLFALIIAAGMGIALWKGIL